MTLRGLRWLNTHVPRQAAPITSTILLDIRARLDLQNNLHLVFWTICITAFFLLFRKSNLIPDTKHGFDPSKQLKRSDIKILPHYAKVTMRWSKVKQFDRTPISFPLPYMPSSLLCPVTALKTMFSRIRTTQSSHCFTLQDSTSWAFLSGVPMELIKLMGDCKSDCYLKYIQFPLEVKTAVCYLIKMRLRWLRF